MSLTGRVPVGANLVFALIQAPKSKRANTRFAPTVNRLPAYIGSTDLQRLTRPKQPRNTHTTQVSLDAFLDFAGVVQQQYLVEQRLGLVVGNEADDGFDLGQV